MSPEQARGQPVDRRADIWAFGCVLFEMLSGRRAFRGETITDTLASVMRDPPPLDALPAATPPRVRLLIARCLSAIKATAAGHRRRPARTQNDAMDAAAVAPAQEQPPSPQSRIRGWRLLAAGLIVVAATAAITLVARWEDDATNVGQRACHAPDVGRRIDDRSGGLPPNGKLVAVLISSIAMLPRTSICGCNRSTAARHCV